MLSWTSAIDRRSICSEADTTKAAVIENCSVHLVSFFRQFKMNFDEKTSISDDAYIAYLEGCFVEPHVEKAKFSHIPALIATTEWATTVDPVVQYVDDPPDADRSPMRKRIWRVRLAAWLAFRIPTGRLLTVDKGDAYIEYSAPDTSVVTRAIEAIAGVWKSSRSPEQIKRQKEFDEKSEAATKAAFGDRIHEMFCVETLTTTEKKEGRGYGTALVASVTAKADAAGRATYLLSSNVNNRGFYEHCGFHVVGEFTLGEDNPTWSKPPIVVQVMTREAAGQSSPMMDKKLG